LDLQVLFIETPIISCLDTKQLFPLNMLMRKNDSRRVSPYDSHKGRQNWRSSGFFRMYSQQIWKICW